MALPFEEVVTVLGSSGPRLTHGTAIPSGTFPANIGDVAFNDLTGAGQPFAWVCIAAGSPGTWIPIDLVAPPLTQSTITAGQYPVARFLTTNPATAGAFTLPPAASVAPGFVITIKNITAALTLTIASASTDNYEGATSISLTMLQTVNVMSSGVTNWYKV